ncbi:hypothetical protein PPYR_10172 [Photinus pyralis]|uniref:RecA family profile 1 domain-containing protein n=2 Tax=Photinus pyralis TaxID=7054 RepID=A0A5N4AFM1_PHOPY|nr:meiotic recombination protein DMC1/LIM15 homolog [Photinus pyralis]KAB0796111.1 hypothetical protein PPYR_10172 [Photinus pyralis]
METVALDLIEQAKSTPSSEGNLGDLEDEECFFQDIALLLEHGVSIEDVRRLQDAGINTIKGVQMVIPKKMLEIEGLDVKKIEKIKEACTKLSFVNGFTTALDVDQRNQIFKLSTGSKKFDKLLYGGIESMAITEVFGEAGCGKTQLSHTLCVTAQMSGPNGYMGGKVIFIDTERTFRTDRLRSIAERFHLDGNTVLENILCARAYTSDHQYDLLKSVTGMLHKEAGVFKLLIVDSIIAHFRVDYYGRKEMAHRQHKLGQLMACLQKISEEYNIAVFITNQITSDLTNLEQGDAQRPVGGNILAHASTCRISLHKDVNERRMAKVYDSPYLASNEVLFTITNGGIDDVD